MPGGKAEAVGMGGAHAAQGNRSRERSLAVHGQILDHGLTSEIVNVRLDGWAAPVKKQRPARPPTRWSVVQPRMQPRSDCRNHPYSRIIARRKRFLRWGHQSVKVGSPERSDLGPEILAGFQRIGAVGKIPDRLRLALETNPLVLGCGIHRREAIANHSSVPAGRSCDSSRELS